MTVDELSEDDKRKSTGSISSLKKLWEQQAKDAPSEPMLSPKLAIKHLNNKEHEDCHNNNGHSILSTNNHQNHQNHQNIHLKDPEHFELPKKPAVPVKPIKLIYATPIQQPPLSGNNNHSSREGILELVQLLEFNLKTPAGNLSSGQWLQLSEKLNAIQSACVTYADTEAQPPHTKFQFRELVTRVENQCNLLRVAASKNVQDNERLVADVGQSLKQLSNTLHR